jgi:hypothetical protein
MAESVDLPSLRDEITAHQRFEGMLQRGAAPLEAHAREQRDRGGRIDYWMQSSIESRRRPWWQVWKR